MITIQGSASKGWLHQAAGFKFEKRYYFDPEFRWDQDHAIDQFLDERFPDYPIYNMESNLGQIEYTRRKQIIVGGIQPNLIIGLVAGADFFCDPDKDSDITMRPMESMLLQPDKLPSPASFLDAPLIKGFDAEIRRLQAEKPDYQVIPPYFWDSSGRATIHGFITTSMKLFGEDIFLLMIDDPELVKRIHGWIADVYLTLIEHYSKLANLPTTALHVGECTGTMLSPDQYHDFIVPFANRMGEQVGGLRWHSCGDSNHLLEPLSEITSLKILDTGSNTRVANIREKFGCDIEINIAPPVGALLERSNPKGIEAWLDRTLENNDGGDLKIVHHLEPGYSLDANLRIHDLLEQKGVVAKTRLAKV